MPEYDMLWTDEEPGRIITCPICEERYTPASGHQCSGQKKDTNKKVSTNQIFLYWDEEN